VYKCVVIYTQDAGMRTNIIIDDELMTNALKATGLRTKREAVELDLKSIGNLNTILPGNPKY